MEQIAEQITEGFIQKLPDSSKFYTPEDLLSAGIPHFVVETLRNNVATTIESAMNLPDSDWIQTDSLEVKKGWRGFVEISKHHIKVPAGKLQVVLGNAVEQCFELAVRPRQSVPQFIFKTPSEIDFETAKARLSSLVVNRALGAALLRYMEKKGKDELTFEQARDIIKKIDRKMIENYHPLNWARVLKPLFELAGPEVDSQLFRKFFEDKEKRNIARKFDLLNKELDETEFIEVLSSAELLDAGGYADEQPQLFGESEEVEVPKKPENTGETEPAEDKDIEDIEDENNKIVVAGDTSADEKKEAEFETEEKITSQEGPGKTEESITDLFFAQTESLIDEEETDISIEKPDDPEEETTDIPLLNKFVFDESISEENEGDEDFVKEANENDTFDEKEPSSIYEELNLVKDSGETSKAAGERFEEGEEEIEERADEEDEQDESTEELSYKIAAEEEEGLPEPADEDPVQTDTVETEATAEDEDEGELPMWRSFLERDDIETESGFEYDEDHDSEEETRPEDEEEFIEEPIYDLTVEEPDPEEKISEVSKWLDDEKNRFVAEIFGDSEMAYEQALLEIIEFNDWKSASRYIENEVFARNRVEVYDEVAVDFTDRLHSYFIEYKS